MIQDVKHLGAELYVKRFRDGLDVVVLENRKIDVEQSGSDHDIAPQVAADVGTDAGCQSRAEATARAVAISRVRRGLGNVGKAIGVDHRVGCAAGGHIWRLDSWDDFARDIIRE